MSNIQLEAKIAEIIGGDRLPYARDLSLAIDMADQELPSDYHLVRDYDRQWWRVWVRVSPRGQTFWQAPESRHPASAICLAVIKFPRFEDGEIVGPECYSKRKD